jgi:hypothetical protein
MSCPVKTSWALLRLVPQRHWWQTMLQQGQLLHQHQPRDRQKRAALGVEGLYVDHDGVCFSSSQLHCVEGRRPRFFLEAEALTPFYDAQLAQLTQLINAK